MSLCSDSPRAARPPPRQAPPRTPPGAHGGVPPPTAPALRRRRAWVRSAFRIHRISPMNDADLLQAFEACRLTAADFRHREHLRVAYLYLARDPFEQAHARFEAGVVRLLVHLGAPASHYHATLTRAWLLAVRHFLRREGAKETSEEFLAVPGGASRLLDQKIMLTHYSAERLFSPAARAGFVEPDLDPIPPLRLTTRGGERLPRVTLADRAPIPTAVALTSPCLST